MSDTDTATWAPAWASAPPRRLKPTKTVVNLEDKFSGTKPRPNGPGLRREKTVSAMQEEMVAEADAVHKGSLRSRKRKHWKMLQSLAMMRRTRKDVQVQPAFLKTQDSTFSIRLPQSDVDVEVVVHLATQHTVTWSAPIVCTLEAGAPPTTLLPGSVNLYHFPMLTPPHVPGRAPLPDVEPTPSELHVLVDLVFGLMLDDVAEYYAAEDDSGARPIHALLISGSQTAMRLCVDLITKRPIRMLDAHGEGIFYGTLHPKLSSWPKVALLTRPASQPFVIHL